MGSLIKNDVTNLQKVVANNKKANNTATKAKIC
jgi:hypothetical protein